MLRQPFAWSALPLYHDSSELALETGTEIPMRPLYRYESDRVAADDILEALQLAMNPRTTKKTKSLQGEFVFRITPKSANDLVSNCLSPSLLPVQVSALIFARPQ